MYLTNTLEQMTHDQRDVVKAVEVQSEKIRNQDYFSEADIKRYLTEIKRVHSLYKKAFNEPAFSWQKDYFSVQMALENEYKFIFSHGQRMTWTSSRWKFALINALAILHYHHSDCKEVKVEMYGFHLMCTWLFFQYFNVSVFDGHHFEGIWNESIKIAKESDQRILQYVMGIKQWRKDNDNVISYINSQKTKWRQEVARIDRLLNGKMKQKEVEMYHIFHWSDPRWSYEVNVRSASRNLGISINGIKKIIRDHGIADNDYWGYVARDKEEADAKYEKEVKWAEKVRSNMLTKKERKDFWRKFTIPNPQLLFRTFTTVEPDLIPASNPLLTTEECVVSNCVNPLQDKPHPIPIPSRMDMMFKDGIPQMLSGFTPTVKGLFGID